MAHLSDILHAFAAQAAPDGPPQSCGYAQLVPIVLMLLVIYFLLIRPQQKQAREHEEMLRALKKGDEVVTQSGLIGRIHGIGEKIVTLEVARDTRVRVLKSQIAGPFRGEAEGGDEKADKKEKN